RPLYKKVYPWFMNAFVSAHFPILRRDRPLLTQIQIACTVAITWWLVPSAIALLWLKYLGVHDTKGTGVQLVMLSASVAIATFLQHLAGATLRGEKRRPLRLYRPSRVHVRLATGVTVVIIIFGILSFGAIRGCEPVPTGFPWAKRLCVPAD